MFFKTFTEDKEIWLFTDVDQAAYGTDKTVKSQKIVVGCFQYCYIVNCCWLFPVLLYCSVQLFMSASLAIFFLSPYFLCCAVMLQFLFLQRAAKIEGLELILLPLFRLLNVYLFQSLS